MTRRCLTLAAATLALWLAPAARAGWGGSIETTPQSGVSINVAAPINEPPYEGAIPCVVTIVNGSGAAHTWEITASSGAMYGPGGGYRNSATQSVQVDNQSTARVTVLLPLEGAGTRYYRQNSIEVSGYGTVGTVANMSGNSPRAGQSYIAIGDALATALWEPLRKVRKDAGADLNGSPLDLNYLGTDWRGLTGYNSLWLTGGEYTGLDPARRQAIRDWVDHGGKLFLFTPSLDPALRTELGLPEGSSQHAAGFGSVTLVTHDEKALSPEEAAPIVTAIAPLHDDARALDASLWKLTARQGGIRLDGLFLIAFIAIFAALVGPVNLFWIAGPSRRHRLFWTTPLISVAASLVLIVVIMVQDGFGGRGGRLLVMRLFPAQRKALLVQEQVARTGVLLSRRFTLSEDALLTPIAIGGVNSGRQLDRSGRSYGGDWFASRSLQAHRLEAMVPSRAEVLLVNAQAARGGAPPEVVSSIPVTLNRIQYVDSTHRRWTAAGLRTGERVILQPAGSSAPPHFSSDGSEFLTDELNRARDEPGSFFAVADEGPFLATLPSIRWKNEPAVYIGPVTEAP